MTQKEFDTRVAVFVDKHLCRTDKVASFDISKDPYTSDLKTRERFFENIIYSLNGYDLSLALFSEKELSYLFELGMLAGRSCGKCTDWFPRIRYTPAEPIFTPVSYGLLYNWYAATDARNITADGWHVATSTEFETLLFYLDPDGTGITNTAGGDMKETGIVHWTAPNIEATNLYGFTARPTGVRRGADGVFASLTGSDKRAYWWNYDENPLDITKAFVSGILSNSAILITKQGIFNTTGISKKYGYGVRLIKDSTTLTHGQTGTYTGNDGKVYRTICIGTQEWSADNLCETLYRNGDPIPEVTDNAAWAALTTGAMCAYNNDWNNA